MHAVLKLWSKTHDDTWVTEAWSEAYKAKVVSIIILRWQKLFHSQFSGVTRSVMNVCHIVF